MLRRFFTITAFTLLGLNSVYSQIQVSQNPDTCAFFQTVSQKNFPPLQSDMPLDIMISWIVIDSLCKTSSYQKVYERAMLTTLDSLKMEIKYCYLLQNYDPLLFEQYHYDLSPYRMRGSPKSFWKALLDAYEERFGALPYYMKVFLGVDMIYHVTVASLSSFIDKPGSDSLETFCADLEVLEKIKGQRIYLPCSLPGIQKTPTNAQNNNCIKNVWTRSLLNNRSSHRDSILWEQWGPSKMEVGKEYIVLLRNHAERLYNNHITWFTNAYYRDDQDLTFWIFEIRNGNVSDPKNKFGMGDNVPIVTFKNAIKNQISTFLGL